MGLKVTDMNGWKISFLRALGRNLAKFISAIILMIGYFMAGFTAKKQALHDMIARTLVIQEKPARTWLVILCIFGPSIALSIAMTVFSSILFGMLGFGLGSLSSDTAFQNAVDEVQQIQDTTTETSTSTDTKLAALEPIQQVEGVLLTQQEMLSGIIVSQATETPFFPYYTYSGDKIYYDDELLSGSDSKTFTVFDDTIGSEYAIDKNHVYYNGEIITGADPQTFTLGNDTYTSDKNNVYYEGEIIAGADPQTFTLLHNGYASDKNNIYYWKDILPNADPKTFKMFTDYYALDKNNAYYKGGIITGADPQTFKVFNDYYAVDKNNAYYKREIIAGADSTTFAVFADNESYATDKNNVYNDNAIIQGADPKTFTP